MITKQVKIKNNYQCNPIYIWYNMDNALVFVFMNLFKTKQEYNLGSLWQLPESMNCRIIANNFRNLIANKLFLSFGSTTFMLQRRRVGCVFVALLAGYGLTYKRKHKNFWFLVIYGTVFHLNPI